MNCNHTNITCDKTAGVYRCADCETVTGHFARIPSPEESEILQRIGRRLAEIDRETRMIAIGNGLYARTKSKA